MPIDPVGVWKTKLAESPDTDDASWANHFAKFATDRTKELEVPGKAFKFKFAEPVFAKMLDKSKMEDAWAAAIAQSSIVPIPPNVSAEIDPSSVSAAKAYLKAAIAGGAPSDDPMKTVFPVAFRNAFAMLKVIITDSSANTAPFPVK